MRILRSNRRARLGWNRIHGASGCRARWLRGSTSRRAARRRLHARHARLRKLRQRVSERVHPHDQRRAAGTRRGIRGVQMRDRNGSRASDGRHQRLPAVPRRARAASRAKHRWMKSVLVTGASKGIGAAIALRLARDQYDIAVHYRTDREGAQRTSEQIERAGGRARLLEFDVADRATARAVLEADMSTYGA